MKNRVLFLSSLLVVSLMLFVVSSYASVSMPHFSLTNVVDGKKVDSSSFHGKALLITFFATWCPPCRQEVHELKKLQKNFSESDFSVIGISVERGNNEKIAAFVESKDINYPVLIANYQIGQDFGGVFGIPTAFLVNKEGNVVKRYQGYVRYSTLERDVVGLVK